MRMKMASSRAVAMRFAPEMRRLSLVRFLTIPKIAAIWWSSRAGARA